MSSEESGIDLSRVVAFEELTLALDRAGEMLSEVTHAGLGPRANKLANMIASNNANLFRAVALLEGMAQTKASPPAEVKP